MARRRRGVHPLWTRTAQGVAQFWRLPGLRDRSRRGRFPALRRRRLPAYRAASGSLTAFKAPRLRTSQFGQNPVHKHTGRCETVRARPATGQLVRLQEVAMTVHARTLPRFLKIIVAGVGGLLLL